MLACWDPFVFLSWQTIVWPQALLQVVELSSEFIVSNGSWRWKNNDQGWIRDTNSATTAASLSRVDFPALTYTAQREPSLRQDGVWGRGDKQKESDGQPVCCERGVCCSFMMCNKCFLFALHLFQEEVGLCATLPWQTIPSQDETFVGLCSGPTLCFR